MKKFFKMVFASMTGLLLGFAILFFVASTVIGFFLFKSEKAELSSTNLSPILKIDLNGELVNKEEKFQFDWGEEIPFFDSFQKSLNLPQLVEVLDLAAKDPNIKGVYLKFGHNFSGGWATIDDFYQALSSFKARGKFIVSYSENYSEKSYYLASIAQKVFAYPAGNFEFNGLSLVQPFFKELIDKLSLRVSVFRAGNYKSAMEPFLLNKMSQENRTQNQELINDLWSQILQRIHLNRQIPIKNFNYWVDNGLIQNNQQAFSLGLIDQLSDERKVWDFILEKLNSKVLAKDKKPKEKNLEEFDENKYFISSKRYLLLSPNENHKNSQKENNSIAYIYLEGEIIDGVSIDGKLGSLSVLEMLRDIQKNKNIKAMVLSINSPGGSALASDVIWSELSVVRKKMPVISIFGDVAASGAYYFASNSDYIIARPQTVTGSIGVFGLLFGVHKLAEEKLGVHFDKVVTSQFSDMGGVHRELNPKEITIIQSEIDDVYKRFLDRIVQGRKLSHVDKIKPYANGRIWSGFEAKKIGLVDELGSNQLALKKAVKMAKLKENYHLEIYPKKKGMIWEIFSGLQEVESKIFIEKYLLGRLGEKNQAHNLSNLIEGHLLKKSGLNIYAQLPLGFSI
jgi:protease-4